MASNHASEWFLPHRRFFWLTEFSTIFVYPIHWHNKSEHILSTTRGTINSFDFHDSLLNKVELLTMRKFGWPSSFSMSCYETTATRASQTEWVICNRQFCWPVLFCSTTAVCLSHVYHQATKRRPKKKKTSEVNEIKKVSKQHRAEHKEKKKTKIKNFFEDNIFRWPSKRRPSAVVFVAERAWPNYPNSKTKVWLTVRPCIDSPKSNTTCAS